MQALQLVCDTRRWWWWNARIPFSILIKLPFSVNTASLSSESSDAAIYPQRTLLVALKTCTEVPLINAFLKAVVDAASNSSSSVKIRYCPAVAQAAED